MKDYKTQIETYIQAQRKTLDEFESSLKEEPAKGKKIIPPSQYGYLLLKDTDYLQNGDENYVDGKWMPVFEVAGITNITAGDWMWVSNIFRRSIPIPNGFELIPEDEDANSIKWCDSKSKTWDSFRNTSYRAKEFLAVIRKKEPAIIYLDKCSCRCEHEDVILSKDAKEAIKIAYKQGFEDGKNK